MDMQLVQVKEEVSENSHTCEVLVMDLWGDLTDDPSTAELFGNYPNLEDDPLKIETLTADLDYNNDHKEKCEIATLLSPKLSRRNIKLKQKKFKVQPTKCKKCDVVVKCEDSLRHHMAYKHSNLTLDDSQFSCGYCSFTAKCGTNLQNHILYNHPLEDSTKWLACTLCSYHAKSKTNISKHMMSVHKSYKAFKCVICGVKFKSMRYLQLHIATRSV